MCSLPVNDAAAECFLNGRWTCRLGEQPPREVAVPGLVSDPVRPSPGPVRLSRRVTRPRAAESALLVLKGARFAPTVYVDHIAQSAAEGGMAWTRHALDLRSTGRSFELQIDLSSQSDLADTDASNVPAADRWRTNLSSGLWDDVVLRFHGPVRFDQLYAFTEAATGRVHARVSTRGDGDAAHLWLRIVDERGRVYARYDGACEIGRPLDIGLPGSEYLPEWSPEHPACFSLEAELWVERSRSDAEKITVARRRFSLDGKRFELNGRRVTLRAGSVVWHRALRDPEFRPLAWDVEWFRKNIVMRLKRMGANTLRFHLGMPPDALLDLCDRCGLMVQAEWPFFHGFPASRASAERQWRPWLEQCFRHPSVCLVHPWNETASPGDAWAAMARAAEDYPPFVLSHRDVQHVHRYWWSLFENVGVQYDSADVFDQAIMADEFGGNYLDGAANPGGYPHLAESFTRFLGRTHTARERLQLQADACGRIAEYWRRIGAAGFSPFCILGSPEDGNHHFLGPLKDGRPKPVWEALRAAYAPVSASLDLWQRNHAPGSLIRCPVHLFNETGRDVQVALHLGIVRHGMSTERCSLAAGEHRVIKRTVRCPDATGSWTVAAELRTPGRTRRLLSRSRWRIWTVCPRPERTRAEAWPFETELNRVFASRESADITPRVRVGGAETYRRLARNRAFRAEVETLLRRGMHIVLLDAGPRFLGAGEDGTTSPPRPFAEPTRIRHALPFGLEAEYEFVPEPESVIHPAPGMEHLAAGLRKENLAIWAGLKGGLIAPAVDLRLGGFSPEAVLTLWTARGAEPEAVRNGPCFAFEKAGCFHFAPSDHPDQARELVAHIARMMADAPGLAARMNAREPLRIHDVHALWREARGRTHAVRPLWVCGKSLARTVVFDVAFADTPGRLILSQLLTEGRLTDSETRADGRRFDPGALQTVFNLVDHFIR